MAVGRRYGGRYEVVDQTAAGSTGWTFVAVDHASNDEVVLEVGHPGSEPPDAAARARFERAMGAAARMDHANVERVRGAGYDHGSFFVASVRPPGQRLDIVLASGRALTPVEVRSLAVELVDALVACHAAGVVHGDLTAESVVLADGGGAALIGLGRAAASGPAPTPSSDGDLVGLAGALSAAVGGPREDPALAAALTRMAAAGAPGGYRDAAEARDDLARRFVDVDAPPDSPRPRTSRRTVVRSLPLAGQIGLGLLGAIAICGLATFAVGRLGFRFSEPPRTTVPDVTAEPQEVAEARLTAEGLSTRFQDQRSATVPAGSVISQEPAAGTDAREGDPVTVVISTGGRPVTVPDLVGRQVADANLSVEALGLVAEVRREGRTNLPTGQVYDQLPSGGDEAREGDRVLLFVAGPR